MSKNGGIYKSEFRIIKTVFANFIANGKCTNTKYPCSIGLKIIAVEYIKINTIFGDAVPFRYECLSKALIQPSDQTQLYMLSTG